MADGTFKKFFSECPNTEEAMGNLHVDWSREGIGFGSFHLYVVDGKLHIDNEGMSRTFIKEVLGKCIDNAILDFHRE
jgi:hypothetical protein